MEIYISFLKRNLYQRNNNFSNNSHSNNPFLKFQANDTFELSFKGREISKEELQKLVNEGKTYAEIGAMYNISKDSVKGYASKYGIKSLQQIQREKSAIITKNDIEKLINIGKSKNEICEILNISINQYKALIKKFGLHSKKAINIVIENITKEQLLDFVNSGKTTYEVKDALGISTGTYTKLLKKFGIKTRNLRSREVARSVTKETLEEFLQQGKSLMEIKQILGLTYETTRAIFEKYNLKTPKMQEMETSSAIISGISKEQLEELFKEGKTIKEVSKELNIGHSSLQQLLKKYNVKTFWQEKTDNIKIEKEDLEILINSGMLRKDIAKRYNVNPDTITRYLRKYGIENLQIQNQKRIAKIPKETLIKLYNSGTSVKAKCEFLNISESTYHRLLRLYKIQKKANCHWAKPLNQISKEEILSLLNEGLPTAEICKILKVSERTFRNRLKQYHILTPMQKVRKRIEGITKEKLSELLDFGLTAEEICKKLKISDSTYKRLVTIYKIKTQRMENSENIASITKEQLSSMLSSGKSINDICRELNISRPSAARLLAQYNLLTERQIYHEKVSNISEKQLSRLISEGYTKEQICNILGIADSMYYQLVEKFDIMIDYKKIRQNVASITKEQILEQIALGKNIKDASRALNVSGPTYRNLLKKFNITVNKTDNYRETHQHRYEQFTLDDLKNRFVEVMVYDKISQNDELCELIDFIDGRQNVNTDKRKNMIGFLRNIDKINLGIITSEQALESSEAQNIREWKDNIDNIQDNFIAVLDILYQKGEDDLANIFYEKYMPDKDKDENIEEAEYIVETIQDVNSDNDIKAATYKLTYWDAKNSNLKTVKAAEKNSSKHAGKINPQRAGQYIVLANMYENYLKGNEIKTSIPSAFFEILKRFDLSSEKATPYLMKLDNWFASDDEDDNYLNKFMERFNINDEISKAIITKFVEEFYINKDTQILTTDNKGREIISTLTAKAKQEIYEHHKSKDDFRILRGFEKAMSKFASFKNDNGVKEYKKAGRKIAELKLTEYSDRVFSYDDDFIFDEYSEKGDH